MNLYAACLPDIDGKFDTVVRAVDMRQAAGIFIRSFMADEISGSESVSHLPAGEKVSIVRLPSLDETGLFRDLKVDATYTRNELIHVEAKIEDCVSEEDGRGLFIFTYGQNDEFENPVFVVADDMDEARRIFDENVGDDYDGVIVRRVPAPEGPPAVIGWQNYHVFTKEPTATL